VGLIMRSGRVNGAALLVPSPRPSQRKRLAVCQEREARNSAFNGGFAEK